MYYVRSRRERDKVRLAWNHFDFLLPTTVRPFQRDNDRDETQRRQLRTFESKPMETESGFSGQVRSEVRDPSHLERSAIGNYGFGVNP